MSDSAKVGTIAWNDLTVAHAETVRDFYQAVVGWTSDGHDMGDYEDYTVAAPGGDVVAGICHARGQNADIPPQWLMYVTVADVDASAQTCVERGGEVVVAPRAIGKSRFCVIKDPAGAVVALITAPGD